MLNLLSTLRPTHYVVVVPSGKGERVEFGRTLPLSKRAASQFAKTLKVDTRVIMRKTAVRAGMLPF
jgi:hypothetical protein